jgi:hypothetical protein
LPASLQTAGQDFGAGNVFGGLNDIGSGIANLIPGFNPSAADAPFSFVGATLVNANSDFMAGVNALPASFQAANQAFAVGDFTGGAELIGGGFLNTVFGGLNTVTGADGVITVTPIGALGDLLPDLALPGQMAQNFTNLLPAGSIPAQLSQNFTNVVNTLTNTSVTSAVSLIPDPNGPFGIGVSIDAHLGLPLQLAIEAIGGPANGLNALGTSMNAFNSAVQAGNVSGAAAAILDAPGLFVDGFLNGHTTLPLSLNTDLAGLPFPTTLNVPLDGILVPAAPYTASIDGSALFGPGVTIHSTVTGTPIGGLLGGLLSFLPADLAAAIGGPPVPVFPPPSF